MSSLKDIAKKKWHPGSNGGGSLRETWRDDFKGLNQVAGWIGKTKDQETTTQHSTPRPIQSLRDPATFGPPPRRLQNEDLTILGPVSLSERIPGTKNLRENDSGEKVRKLLPPPPTPHRASSKLNCENCESLAPRTGPKLPPRLPPRGKSNFVSFPSKPETNLEIGISKLSLPKLMSTNDTSIRGFDRASKSACTPKPTSDKEISTHSRISTLLPVTATNSITGTTFSQKRAALKTFSSLRSDPSSISVSDAKNAAFTANNFRERHGDQVKSGLHLANKLDDKHKILQKLGSNQASSEAGNRISVNSGTKDSLKDILVKKKPPPPPPSRADLVDSKLSIKCQPPSIPLTSKPKWTQE